MRRRVHDRDGPTAFILAVTPQAATEAVGNEVIKAWLATQNLPEGHRDDVIAFATDIPDALLFSVETLTGSAMAAARDWAIDGLRSIPHDDENVRRKVVEAATRWMRKVSRGVEEGMQGSEEHERSRATSMVDLTGSDDDGPRTILGVEVVFVPRADGAAYAHVPALLEGYPLAAFLDLFELAALHLAIRGRHDNWQSLKWLTLMNEIDFDGTAAALQARADGVAACDAEPGVKPQLAQRVAALLLWLSNDPTAERRAADIDPRLGRWMSYKDYDANPVASMFALERRHADILLARRDVTAAAKARRLKGFIWDPGLAFDQDTVADVVAAADIFDVSHASTGAFSTAEDLALEELSSAIARSSPAALARLQRRRIEFLSSMDPLPPVLGDAAYDSLLVGDDATKAALSAARASIPTSSQTDIDAGNRQLLLQPELIDMDAEAQIDAILAADLPQMFTNLRPFLKPLEAAATDSLVRRHGDAPAKTVDDLVVLLGYAAIELGAVALAWLAAIAMDATRKCQTAAFEALARCRPEDFGRTLHSADWTWQAGKETLSHYGSLALTAATTSIPFEMVAPRLAPWLVAHAAVARGGSPSEVGLAAEILDGIVRNRGLEAPDPGSRLTIDLTVREADPFSLTLTPGDPMEGGNPIERLNAAMNVEQRAEFTKRAVEVATARINAARMAGASLYLASINPDDLVPMLTHAGDIVDGWLDGMGTGGGDFRLRVQLAEGFFLSLTEALMRNDLDRGLPAWIAVREAMHTKFIGDAGIDKPLLMLLRAPAEDQVEDHLRDLIMPRLAHSDDILLDISIAAVAGGREHVVEKLAQEDLASGVRWRLERGKALQSFSGGEGAPPIFPDGRGTSTEMADATWGMRRYRDHSARHWWNAFWSAQDGEVAFASWTMLETCVDRRAAEWISREWPRPDANFPLLDRKRAFAAGKHNELMRAAMKTDEKLNRSLYGREVVSDLKPWTQLVPVTPGAVAEPAA